MMRVCRLNRIKIKDPEKWDKAKYDAFIGNEYVCDSKKKLLNLFAGRHNTLESHKS